MLVAQIVAPLFVALMFRSNQLRAGPQAGLLVPFATQYQAQFARPLMLRRLLT